jgi:hypothetical protein
VISTTIAEIKKAIMKTHGLMLTLYEKLFSHLPMKYTVTGTEIKEAIKTRMRLVRMKE